MAALTTAERRVHRCVWLTARLLLSAVVDLSAYQARFHVSERSYYRDLDLLRRIGIELQAERADRGRVRFVSESL